MGVKQKLRYAVNEISENYRDRYWWRSRIAHRLVGNFHTKVYPRFTDAVDVMEKDWDTLIVLDACRVDLFESAADLGRFDEISTVVSKGSATAEWTKNTFSGNTYGDTIYVTANPYTTKLAPQSFHDIINVWKEDFDDDINTVPPDAVTEAARKAVKEYPNKRHIIHYVQPHQPFIGHDELYFDGWHPGRVLGEGERGERPYHVWNALEMGMVDESQVWSGYRDNLELVLKDVYELLEEVTGKTVVTSDHGNLFGEFAWPFPIRLYGHPRKIRHPALVNVPWAERDGDRRQIVDDGVNEVAISADAQSRLRQLGYVE